MNENEKTDTLDEIAKNAAEAQGKSTPANEKSAVSDEPGTGNTLVMELKRGVTTVATVTIPRYDEAHTDQESVARDVILIEQAIERLTGTRCHATLTIGLHKPRTRG